MKLPNKVGNAPLLVISLKKPSFLLQILGNGGGRNQKTMISLLRLKAKFSISKACTLLSKTTPCSSNSMTSTTILWPKKRPITSSGSKRDGRLRVTEIHLSSTTLLSKGTGRIEFPTLSTQMVPIPPLLIS